MLKLNNVYKIYENGTLAVRNASLEFPGYGLVAIIGSSGCGKSTLLNLLSNNDIPSKGELLYNDIPYNKVDKDILNKDFAIIYQDFKLIENLSVYQNIMLSHELSNKDIDKDFVLSVADKLGITEILDEKVYSLSGGQQQRVAIARALVRRPKVIFADEPTGNLDSENTNKVYEILKELSKEILVVIVSHEKSISQYADRIIEMQNGKVIGDYKGDFTKIIERDKVEREVLDTETDYKPKKNIKEQTNNKKPSKIGSKSIFSYTKGKNRLRKKKGLSLNSTLGLTIAFNNKKIGKKVTLLVITTIMVAIIFATTAILFSSNDTSFCNIMKSNNVPYITYTVGGESVMDEDAEQIGTYISSKYGVDSFATSKHKFHHYINSIVPVEELYSTQFSNNMRFMFEDFIYVDEPEDIGLKIIKGRAPKYNNGVDEIAVSKTCYNFILETKLFQNIDGEIVDFGARDIIGSYIEELRFAITGVFEDYNELDMKSDSLNRNDIYYYNPLIYTALRPKDAVIETKSILMEQSQYKICTDDENIGFYDFYPCNNIVKKHHYRSKNLNNQNLLRDEVVLDMWFVNYYRRNKGIQLKEGDKISLQMVKIKSSGFSVKIDKVMQDYQTFTIKAIVDEFPGIMINEQLYNEWSDKLLPITNTFVINSKIIKPSVLKDIRKYVVGLGNNNNPFSVGYNMIKHNGNNGHYNWVVFVAKMSVALPFCILSLIVFGILITINIVDMIKYKGLDILVLKSLGIKQKEVLKIFAAMILIVLIVKFVIGIVLGLALTYAVNLFFTILCNYNFYTPTFYVSILSISVMIIMIIGISSLAVLYSLQRLNGKNLRRLFQRQKN